MSLNYAPQTQTAEDYQRIFELERQLDYPSVYALECGMGFAIDKERLEAAARVLSCPIKAAAPSWQHGRVIYATWRNYLAHKNTCPECDGAGKVLDAPQRGPGTFWDACDSCLVTIVDLGTAKGFSALMAMYALLDSGRAGTVTSADVMPPEAKVRRNTPAEVDELKTLHEILEPFQEANGIQFVEKTGIGLLQSIAGRIHLAFVDGKHSYEAVSEEAKLLAARQQPGDLVIFDDVQMAPVGKAVNKVAGKYYDLTTLRLGTVNRAYAIGARK